MSVEYLVTGKDSKIKIEVDEAVFPIVKKILNLSKEDLSFFDDVLNRLKK